MVRIDFTKPVNIGKLINELAAAGFTQTRSRENEYIEVDGTNATVTIQAIYDAHDPNPTAAEQAAAARALAARANAKAIPSWAAWSELEAQTWADANIGGKLTTGRATLPPSITLANIRPVILAILDILDGMYALQWATVRMVLALRDAQWPDLKDK